MMNTQHNLFFFVFPRLRLLYAVILRDPKGLFYALRSCRHLLASAILTPCDPLVVAFFLWFIILWRCVSFRLFIASYYPTAPTTNKFITMVSGWCSFHIVAAFLALHFLRLQQLKKAVNFGLVFTLSIYIFLPVSAATFYHKNHFT
jgi:hypothetical protein